MTDIQHTTHRAAAPHWFSSVIARGVLRMLDAYSVVQERRQLRELGWRELEDLGIAPENALKEMRKPIWCGRSLC